MPAHVFGHRIDDRLEVLRFVRLYSLFGQAQPIVVPLSVDQMLDQGGRRLAQDGIKDRAKKWLEAPLEM
jgi:hypothetical protein